MNPSATPSARADEAPSLIAWLMRELATELDMHYDDEDMFALKDSFTPIKAAAIWMTTNGYPVDECVRNIVARFDRHRQ